MVEGVLGMFRADRRGEAVDAALLKSVLRMLTDLGVYESVFLEPFLADARAVYAQEGASLAASLPVPDYLLHCEARLASELER